MDARKRQKLEAAGFKVGSVAEFLGLTPAESKLIELRLDLALRVRQLREQSGLTQQELARRMKSSQSRVAKIESAEAGVTLDLCFRALFALGGEVSPLTPPADTPQPARRKRTQPA